MWGRGDKFWDSGTSTYGTTCFDAEAVQMILKNIVKRI